MVGLIIFFPLGKGHLLGAAGPATAPPSQHRQASWVSQAFSFPPPRFLHPLSPSSLPVVQSELQWQPLPEAAARPPRMTGS